MSSPSGGKIASSPLNVSTHFISHPASLAELFSLHYIYFKKREAVTRRVIVLAHNPVWLELSSPHFIKCKAST